jgi:hypothetical protein
VNIKRQSSFFTNETDDRRAEGNVIDEVAVHDVAMDPVGAGLFDTPDFVGQMGEIGGEDGWSDENGHKANVQRSTLNVQSRIQSIRILSHWAFGVGGPAFADCS